MIKNTKINHHFFFNFINCKEYWRQNLFGALDFLLLLIKILFIIKFSPKQFSNKKIYKVFNCISWHRTCLNNQLLWCMVGARAFSPWVVTAAADLLSLYSYIWVEKTRQEKHIAKMEAVLISLTLPYFITSMYRKWCLFSFYN